MMLTYCQPPAGYITHSRSRMKQMSSCAFLVSGLSPSICWTGWHRINYHVHWIAYRYINSLRQPHCTARTQECLLRLISNYGMRPGKLQTITFLPHQRVSFVLRLRQSFPEDCVRLKLSSTRASQAGLREMMTRRRVRSWLSSRIEEAKQPTLNA